MSNCPLSIVDASFLQIVNKYGLKSLKTVMMYKAGFNKYTQLIEAITTADDDRQEKLSYKWGMLRVLHETSSPWDS